METVREYQICNRCVMDTSDPDIIFDNNGFCNHCTAALVEKPHVGYVKGESEKKLSIIIDRIKRKGKGKKYDCLMGVSGGVDSSYVVYLAVSLGLRPLLMHLDNGWDSEIAVQNIKNLAETYKLDYVSYVIDWSEFREVQLAFLKASSVDLELPTDLAILASKYKMASKYNIKYTISGGNASAESILPLTWGYHVTHDLRMYKHIVKTYARRRLRKVPTVSVLEEIYYKFVKNIKNIYLLSYVDYNKDEARKFLTENCGWQDYGGKHHESKITAFWQGFVMPTKFNMDYRRATLSSQICANQVTRKEALLELQRKGFDDENVMTQKNFIAKKYNISLEELNSYLSMPPKTYKDFPNNKKLSELIFKIYRILFNNGRI